MVSRHVQRIGHCLALDLSAEDGPDTIFGKDPLHNPPDMTVGAVLLRRHRMIYLSIARTSTAYRT